VQLYQAEWCPHSHKLRQRLTELGLDFSVRQVAAEPEERGELERVAATNEIPVLVTDEGKPLRGEDEIFAFLERFVERRDAAQHRAKAREEVPTFEESASAT
jgi:glutathione S-transferase